jgi:hypothetical protein
MLLLLLHPIHSMQPSSTVRQPRLLQLVDTISLATNSRNQFSKEANEKGWAQGSSRLEDFVG